MKVIVEDKNQMQCICFPLLCEENMNARKCGTKRRNHQRIDDGNRRGRTTLVTQKKMVETKDIFTPYEGARRNHWCRKKYFF